METPQISRSGRVLKKSAKVKEMEDFDINELDMQGKPKKKGRTSDEYEEFDDKRVAPIKIPKISLNLSTAPKRPPQMMQKMPTSPMKSKPEGRFMMRGDSSPDGSKESDSSSLSSETSSSSPSSSDESDGGEGPDMRQRYSNSEAKGGQLMHNVQHYAQQEKVIVETNRQQFDSPSSFVDQNTEMSMEASDDETSDSALVIAEESSDSFMSRGQKSGALKKRPLKKDPAYPPRKGGIQKKRPVARNIPAAAKKEKPAGKSRPLTAYMLWCAENRKRIAASGVVGLANIGKKMGDTWQALPDKEKMAWRRKAKRIALKGSGGLISTGPINEVVPKTVSRSTSSSTEDALRNLAEGARALGTSAIDSAAYLKLLGDSLSVIGQRLTEHEGQLAVSGIFSVLLDTILCVVGPLLCLTSESPVLNSLPQDTSRRTLDSIAYFMPGL